MGESPGLHVPVGLSKPTVYKSGLAVMCGNSTSSTDSRMGASKPDVISSGDRFLYAVDEPADASIEEIPPLTSTEGIYTMEVLYNTEPAPIFDYKTLRALINVHSSYVDVSIKYRFGFVMGCRQIYRNAVEKMRGNWSYVQDCQAYDRVLRNSVQEVRQNPNLTAKEKRVKKTEYHLNLAKNRRELIERVQNLRTTQDRFLLLADHFSQTKKTFMEEDYARLLHICTIIDVRGPWRYILTRHGKDLSRYFRLQLNMTLPKGHQPLFFQVGKIVYIYISDMYRYMRLTSIYRDSHLQSSLRCRLLPRPCSPRRIMIRASSFIVVL